MAHLSEYYSRRRRFESLLFPKHVVRVVLLFFAFFAIFTIGVYDFIVHHTEFYANIIDVFIYNTCINCIYYFHFRISI